MKRILGLLVPLSFAAAPAFAACGVPAATPATTTTTSATATDSARTTTTTTTTTTTNAAPEPAKVPMPAVGTEAPGFSLPSQDGSKVELASYRGKWVVLYFYPKDFTGGCTLEAQSFQRDLGKYKAKGAVVLGVSVDSVSSHKDFCVKESLQYKLLADPDHTVVDKYGTLVMYNGTPFASRTTFVIDPKGIVRKVYPKVQPATHSAEVLTDLAALKKAAKG
jgi:peroxiredoxin Q/BCP